MRKIQPFREQRWLVLPDEHWPYVDLRAWELAIRVGKFADVTHVVSVGDAFDFYSASFHDKNPARARFLVDEIIASRRRLRDLRSLKVPCHMLFGNHENRLERFISKVATPLRGLDGLSIPEVLGYKAAGFTWSPYQDEFKIGKVTICHDYGDCGTTALKKAVETTDTDTVMGHVHTRQEYVTTSRRTGRKIRGMTFGWLGSYDAIREYKHKAKARRQWPHGVGILWTRPDRSARMEAIEFVNGTAKVEGQRV